MSQINGLMELTDHEAEAAAGACQLVAVAFVDNDGNGSVDEIWMFYAC